MADPPFYRKRRAYRYPPEWRFGPDLYQCTLGVIVAASSGVRSATKFFGKKIIAKVPYYPDELVRSVSLTTILLPVLLPGGSGGGFLRFFRDFC